MRTRNFVYRLIGVVCAFSLVACVDDSFNLDDVSTEVTVGNGTTVIPLGYIENKTISDLLGGQDIEGLEKDENGNLSFNYSGESDTIDIENISSEFEIPEMQNSFDVDYPEFDLTMQGIQISKGSDIELAGLEDYAFSNIGFYIPEGIALPTVSGSFSEVLDDDSCHISFQVPEQVAGINKIFFADVESGHSGAPIRLRVDLNDMAGVNGGGELTFNFSLNGGTFRILDSNNVEVCNGSSYTQTVNIAEGAESVEIVMYVESLTNTTALDSDHYLNIPLSMSFDADFEIKVKSGHFSLATKPHVELAANFEFKDAEVSVAGGTSIMECGIKEGEPIEVTGLPAEIKMINRISVKQDDRAVLRFYARGLSWLGDDVTENIEVAVALPDFLKLHHIAGQGYEFNEATGELKASVADLDRGLEIGLETLDFGAEGLVPDADGKIELSFAPVVSVRFVDDACLNVSSLVHDGGLDVSFGIEEALLCIESLSGRVDYVYEVDQQFALKGLDQLNLEIAGLGLKPIIEVNIEHPLTMSATLSGSVTPSTKGVVNEQNRVEFSGIEITPAVYAGGNINPAKIALIIADESLREQYSDAKYTFVACDVTKLLLGTLPDTLDINISIAVDSQMIQTLYVAESFSITYDYKVDVPFTIDNSFEINYKGQVTDLNPVFETVAGYDIEVGDLTLIATVVNSTPLEFAADVTLLNKDGEPAVVQVLMDDDTKIHGSSDGVTAAESVIRLTLDLGADGKVSSVGEVDGVRLELSASSAANDTAVPLNNNQYVGVKLQLELAGGVTVDLDKLMQN